MSGRCWDPSLDAEFIERCAPEFIDAHPLSIVGGLLYQRCAS